MWIPHLKASIAIRLIAILAVVGSVEQQLAEEPTRSPVDARDELVVNVGLRSNSNEVVVYDGDRSIPVLESGDYFQREQTRQAAIAGEESLAELLVVIRAALGAPTGLILEMVQIAEDVGFERFLLITETDAKQADRNFDIRMPIDPVDSRDDTMHVVPVRLWANDDGSLQQVYFGQRPLGNDSPACFQRLNNQLAGLVGAGGLLADDDLIVEIDAAYDLDYEYTVEAVSACRGRIHPTTGQFEQNVSKVRFMLAERTGG